MMLEKILPYRYDASTQLVSVASLRTSWIAARNSCSLGNDTLLLCLGTLAPALGTLAADLGEEEDEDEYECTCAP